MKIFIALLTTLIFVLDLGFAEAQKKLELNDLDKLYTLDDPQISPDGKSVLILVYKPDTITNTNKSFIYKVDVATGISHQLTYDRPFASYPRWSPDGESIAFIAGDGTPIKEHIFILSLLGGESRKLTNSSTCVKEFSWKPDGTAIAFLQQDEAENEKEIARCYDAFEIKSNSMFLNAKPLSFHIWLIATRGGEAKRLTAGNWSVQTASPLSWSPDGRYIAFQRNESPYSGELIYTIQTIEPASGKMTRITSSEIQNNFIFRERQPIFSPDGKYISYSFQEETGPGFPQVYYINANGGTGKNITSKLDCGFNRKEWSPDSRSLLVAADANNTVGLWLQPLDGVAKKINLNNLCITGGYNFNIGKNNFIAIIASTSHSPEELYWIENATSAPKKLTNFHAEINNIQFGKQETVHWKSYE